MPCKPGAEVRSPASPEPLLVEPSRTPIIKHTINPYGQLLVTAQEKATKSYFVSDLDLDSLQSY